MTEPMKTFEQLQQDWGNSTCGKEPEQYIYDYMKNQVLAERERIKDTLNKVQGSWSYQQVIDLIDSL